MHQQALLPPIHPTSGYQQTWPHKFMLALSIVSQSMVNSYILASPYFLLLHSCPHLFETAGSSLQLATAPPDLPQSSGFLNTALLVSSQTAKGELAVFQCKHSPELSCDVFKGKNKPPPHDTQLSFFTPHFSYIKENNLCCVTQSSCYCCACYNKKFFSQSSQMAGNFRAGTAMTVFVLLHHNSTTKMLRQQN